VLKLGLQSLEDDADHVNVTVVQTQLDICHARTSSTIDPVPFSANDKVKLGRFLQFQNDEKEAARATLIVHQVKPADFAGTLVLKPLDDSDKVTLFGVEQPGKETALTIPIEIPNSSAGAKGKKFFAEGKTLSFALIDTGFQLDVKDVEDQADIVRCTVISLRLVKIQTSERPPAGGAFVFKEDDDFTPRLNEQAKVHAIIEGNLQGFTGTVRVDFGRLTNRPNKATTPLVNESFTLLARVEQATTPGKGEVEVVWDGKATVAAAQEYSDRKTKNNNGGAQVNIPIAAVTNGQPVPHGLYVIDQLTLLQGTEVLAIHRPSDADLSVPILVNLSFNANWAGDVQTYGLAPFQSNLEEGLRRFGGRDYLIRDATLSNRINARFVTDATLGNAVSVFNDIGGADPHLFGSTPDGPAPLADNLYAFNEGIGRNISIFPGTFIDFNVSANAVGQAAFRGVFGPMGVPAGASQAAPAAPTARAVDAGGNVTGACNAVDFANVTVTLDNDGMATVATTNPALVPAARASAIQAAMRAFVRMVGNTINHESAHALGVVSRIRAENKITIGGVTVTSPLNGDAGAHNRVTNNTNIVDDGGTRSFQRRIEAGGLPQQHFNATNAKYLQDCVPFDRKDN
jgi:hypothetical protein